MSENPRSDRAKTLFYFGIGLLLLLAITYYAVRRERGTGEHPLPQITANNFEVEVLKAENPVLVDFYADWCGPCRMMEPVLIEFAKENPNVKVVQVNVDDNAELAQHYQINSIPNIILFKNGEKIARQVGVTTKDGLKELVEQ
jgi:thioredoxin 1